MTHIPRRLTHAALVFLLFAVPAGSIQAQDKKERELRPDFDFSTIQMPVEFVSVKLKGIDVHPGEKIKGNDDWLLGLSFTLKNMSDKPIAYLSVGLRFLRPERVVGYVLSYGVDSSRGELRRESSPSVIQSGESVTLMLTNEKYPNFLEITALAGGVSSFETVPYYLDRVSFEGEPDIIWEGGNLKRRDPQIPSNFDVIGRYVLPARQN